MTAAAQVFAIPELLEMILTHAHIKTLLRCQSVDKLFHATTLTSKKLRRTLYLDPEESAGRDALDINPLFQRFRKLNMELKHDICDEKWTISFNAPNPYSRCKAALSQGSWRNMLVSQPSCSVSLLHYTFMKGSRGGWLSGPLMLPTTELRGRVTMGQIVDAFKKAGVYI